MPWLVRAFTFRRVFTTGLGITPVKRTIPTRTETMGRSELVAACVLCLLAGAMAAPAAGIVPVTTPDGGIGDVSLSGPAVVESDAGTTDAEASTLSGDSSRTTLWQSDPFRASTMLTEYPDVAEYRICAYAIANGTRSELGCERATALDDSTTSVNLTGLTWPANTSGNAQLSIELSSATDPGTTLDNRTLGVTILTKGGDTDRDGLTNEEELKLGLDPLEADMDMDGLADGTEVNDYGTSPRTADTDGDGVRDGEEVQVGSDPTEADADSDGLTDDTELTVGTDPTSPRTTERLAVGASALLYVGVSMVVLRRRREGGDGDDPQSQLAARAPQSTLNDALTGGGNGDAPTAGARAPELLTDEDRVRHLLDRSGGRMKQSAIVEETGWSKAKVSRLLSTMDDDGAIEKLSLGRENVISLDREWIDARTSPDTDADPTTDTDGDIDSDDASGGADADSDSTEPEAIADGAGRPPPAEDDP